MFNTNLNRINPLKFLETLKYLTELLEEGFTEDNATIFYALRALAEADDWQLMKFIKEIFELSEKELSDSLTTLLNRMFHSKIDKDFEYKKEVEISNGFSLTKAVFDEKFYEIEGSIKDFSNQVSEFTQNKWTDSKKALFEIYPIEGNWCAPTIIEAIDEFLKRRNRKNLGHFAMRVVDDLLKKEPELFANLGICNCQLLIPVFPGKKRLIKITDEGSAFNDDKHKYTIGFSRFSHEYDPTFIAMLSQ